MKEKHKNILREQLSPRGLLLSDELPIQRGDGGRTPLTVYYDKARKGYVFSVRKEDAATVRILVSAENIPRFLEWAEKEGYLNKT